MKKVLLMGAAMLVGIPSALALEEVFGDEYLTAVSPNGEWVAGAIDDGSVIIRSLSNLNKPYTYFSNGGTVNYYIGNGTSISNTGVVVGSTTGNNASYWENGKWTDLQTPNPEFMSNAQSITPDGRVICGGAGFANFGIESETLMIAPAIWYRQSDGSYSDAIILPHPRVDFTGREPQYITAVAISEDGKTIAGQIRDSKGMMHQPIFYFCDDDGNWTYTLPFNNLLNPDHIVFPEYPGEFEGRMPVQEQYMTPEELEDYHTAIEEYYNGERDDYPEYEEFMTPEEIAKYDAAFQAYLEAYIPWAQKWEAYEMAYDQCMQEGYVFTFNNVMLSADGKYCATSRERSASSDYFDGGATRYTPVLLYTDGSDYKELDGNDGLSLLSSSVSANADILATYIDPQYIEPRRAYIFPQMSLTAMPLEDYIAPLDPEIAYWMKDEMTHSCVYEFNNLGQPQFKDFMCSGAPICVPDMSLILTFLTTDGWQTADAYYYSYLFSTGIEPSGVEAVDQNVNKINILAGGAIEVEGDFTSMEIYNIGGAKVFSKANPSGTIPTGLSGGIYIIRATTHSGDTLVRKVSL